ncbi:MULTISPECIES: cell envelope integrity protein TolA [unclassified Neptuniibacter]|uniref:cell envelope integrity protein TolA n=1 Tax=unclassified Neptuniibacter TaxID=2630693 RepID=UPI000C6A78BF|nr:MULTISPECIES: cell envelope integrity protein TolA [unclassified Neptuniibacter]MAY42102.1 protein TolA [Oceanospirillaceae bacterium]
MRLGSYLLPTVLAVILHAVVVVLLAQSWFEHDDPVRKIPRHVQASIVDMKTHKAQQKKASEDKAKQKSDIQRAADAEKKRKAEQKKKQLAKEKADKKKAEDKKRQQEIDKKKAAEIKKKADAKKKAEQKRIEDAKLKKAAEKKRKDEAAKKAKAAEAKRKADAKKAEVARKEAEAAAAEKSALIRAMEEEEAALLAEEQRASAMSYEAYIVDQVTRNWRRSPSARNGMVVEVTVHLLPSGRVNDRYVTKPSGDSRFDEDALRAIDRVSVFEKLQDLDPVVFDRYFRKRVLRFRPEDLRD